MLIRRTFLSSLLRYCDCVSMERLTTSWFRLNFFLKSYKSHVCQLNRMDSVYEILWNAYRKIRILSIVKTRWIFTSKMLRKFNEIFIKKNSTSEINLSLNFLWFISISRVEIYSFQRKSIRIMLSNWLMQSPWKLLWNSFCKSTLLTPPLHLSLHIDWYAWCGVWRENLFTNEVNWNVDEHFPQ